MKTLWETTAEKKNASFGCNFTFSQVENRWQVLKRNYKKMVDNNNKTGRGRRSFTFEKETAKFLDRREISTQICYWIRPYYNQFPNERDLHRRKCTGSHGKRGFGDRYAGT
nr:unnamed protein product [Callosobruchus analis]